MESISWGKPYLLVTFELAIDEPLLSGDLEASPVVETPDVVEDELLCSTQSI